MCAELFDLVDVACAHGDEPSEALLEHLVFEFGDHGERAAEFLRTAADLRRSPANPASPRRAECVAYCLREALKMIPQSQAVAGSGAWRTRSRSVTDAKRRYEQVRGLPLTSRLPTTAENAGDVIWAYRLWPLVPPIVPRYCSISSNYRLYLSRLSESNRRPVHYE